ncbi:hypothetical protein BH20VER1_BH20VER1_28760 [soil metagenome]
MDSSTKDKFEGKSEQAKGAVKETFGSATGNRDMEAEGKADRASGKIEEKKGDVKKVFGQ